MPTRSQIIGAGGLPYPTQYQYTHPWHLDGKGAQPGAKLMIHNGAEGTSDGEWMQSPGYAMSFRQVTARPAVDTSNRFAAFAAEEAGEAPWIAGSLPSAAPAPKCEALTCPTVIGRGRDQCGSQDPTTEAPAPPESIVPRAEKSTAKLGVSHKCCRSKQCHHGSGPGLRTLIEKRTQSLRPLQSKWEKITAILDCCASVTVVPPHVGRDYEITRGEAAIAGVRYEIADGNEIPNLGEKLLPVMTREGTWRSLRAEVADISRPLQSVRSLVKTGHRVVFGGGDDGNFHYIENVMTGEVNAVGDDGSNYFMTYAIAPKAQASFAGQTH